MKIEDMADLTVMYDTQAAADKIICLATGEDIPYRHWSMWAVDCLEFI